MRRLLLLLSFFLFLIPVNAQVLRASPAYNKVAAAGGASTLLDGLVSYWTLNETSGDALDAEDSNDGTVDAGVTRNITGKIGKCDTFDGDGYENIVIGDPANLQLTVFTISLWARSSAGGVGGWWVNYTSATNAGIRFNDDADAARIIISDGSNTAQKRVGPINDGDWHHYVATFDGTNLNLYIDGDVQGSAATFAYTISYAGTNECQIGGMNYGDIYVGSLDEIGVWNRAMAGSGVDSLWNSGSGITHPFTP